MEYVAGLLVGAALRGDGGVSGFGVGVGHG